MTIEEVGELALKWIRENKCAPRIDNGEVVCSKHDFDWDSFFPFCNFFRDYEATEEAVVILYTFAAAYNLGKEGK